MQRGGGRPRACVSAGSWDSQRDGKHQHPAVEFLGRWWTHGLRALGRAATLGWLRGEQLVFQLCNPCRWGQAWGRSPLWCHSGKTRLCLLAHFGWRGWAVRSKEGRVRRLDGLPALGHGMSVQGRVLRRAWGSALPAPVSPTSALLVPAQALPTRTSRAKDSLPVFLDPGMRTVSVGP